MKNQNQSQAASVHAKHIYTYTHRRPEKKALASIVPLARRHASSRAADCSSVQCQFRDKINSRRAIRAERFGVASALIVPRGCRFSSFVGELVSSVQKYKVIRLFQAWGGVLEEIFGIKLVPAFFSFRKFVCSTFFGEDSISVFCEDFVAFPMEASFSTLEKL